MRYTNGLRYIKELNKQELEKVFENNAELQRIVFDRMFDSAQSWNDEYLFSWKNNGIDYRIGWDRGSYFKCTDRKYFVEGLKKAQNCFGFLHDKYNDIIEYVEKLLYKLDYLYYNGSYKNYDMLENRIDEIIEELAATCYKRFMSEYEYCFNYENQLDYFLEFYDDILHDEFYIDSDYILYEYIEYFKCYK